MPEGAARPTRILFAHHDFGFTAGGGENYTRRLILELLKRGYSVDLYYTAARDHSVRFPYHLPAGATLKPVRGEWRRQWGQALLSGLGRRLAQAQPASGPRWNHLQDAIRWRTVYWHNRRFAERVAQKAHRDWAGYDLAFVYANFFLASEAARHLPTCLRLPGPLNANRLKWLDDIQVVCANGDALLALRRSVAGARAIAELPIGLDTAQFQPGGQHFRQRLGWPDSSVVLGYAGRITSLKGVWLLARAFESLAQRWPEIRLLMVGAGEELAQIRSALERAGLGGRIFFPGDQPAADLPAWYRSMDLFVMPSLYENLSNAVLEAMACGLPVLASRVGGNCLLVQENRNGWLFETDSSQDLSAQLAKALERRAEWPGLGQNSRRRAEEHQGWDRVADVFEGLMRPHLGRAGGNVAAG